MWSISKLDETDKNDNQRSSLLIKLSRKRRYIAANMKEIKA